MTPKRFCITGATAGIGRSLCKLLANENVAILAIARSHEKLLALQKQFPSISIFCSDLTLDYKKAAEAIIAFNANVLINNAGVGYYGAFENHTEKELEETLKLKVLAATHLISTLSCYWKKNGQSGVILNVSSVAAFLYYPYFACYSAANRYLLHLSNSLYHELKPFNIYSLCFCPGSVATEFAVKASHGFYKESPQMAMSQEQVAKAILWQIEKKKRYLIYNYKFKFLVYLMRCLPFRLQSYLLKKTIARRLPKI